MPQNHPISLGSYSTAYSCGSDANKYKYGFNGKEKDNETNVEGGDYDFGARIYDSRIGRWLSLDPLQAKYPSLSPYNFCANNAIIYTDPNGREIVIHYKDNEGNLKSYTYAYKTTCTPPNNQFVLNAINSLNAIHEGSKTGSQILTYLEASAETTSILPSDETGFNAHDTKVKFMVIENKTTYSEGFPDEYGASGIKDHVIWDDLVGGITNSTGCNVRPPASMLMHELTHSYLIFKQNEIKAAIDALSDEDKKGDKGTDLWKKFEEFGKAIRDENELIANYENVVNSEMGWGTRIEAGNIKPHDNAAQPKKYNASNPLSQDTTNSCNDDGKVKQNRTDDNNSPCEH